MEQLNRLIGMPQLKQDIQNIVNLIKIQQMRSSKGMKTVAMSRHLVLLAIQEQERQRLQDFIADLSKIRDIKFWTLSRSGSSWFGCGICGTDSD